MQLRNYLLLFAILAVGLACRLIGLDQRSLWLDEATSLDIAQKSIDAIVFGKGFDHHTPPLYYLVLHTWFLLTEASIWNLRLLSTLLDLCNIVLLFSLTRSLFDARSAILVSFLYAASPFPVYYGQEGRMYTLLVLQVLACARLGVTARSRSLRGWELLLLLTTVIAGLYTHYYFALAFAGISASLLLHTREHLKERFLPWFLVCLIAAIAYIPWLSVISKLASGPGQTFRVYTWTVLPYAFFRFVAGYGVFPFQMDTKQHFFDSVEAHAGELILYSSFFGLATLIGLATLWKQKRGSLTFILGPLLLPPVVALIISLKIPMLSERYLIVCYPFFLMLVAACLIRAHGPLQHMFSILILSLGLVALILHHRNPFFGNTQWRDAAEAIQSSEKTNEVLVNPHYASSILTYYLNESFTISGHNRGEPPQSFWLVERGTQTPSAIEEYTKRGWTVLSRKILPKENGIRLYLLDQPRPLSATSPDAG